MKRGASAPNGRKLNLDAVVKSFIVAGDRKVSLARHYRSAVDLAGISKGELMRLLRENTQQLAAEQSKLYAQNTYALLVVLQGMDAAGKDSTIKHVMSGVNPQGCQVYSFKTPSLEEMDHDYLWRCARLLPERGNIGIFNRSYYEEVLVPRVHPEILARQQLPAALKDKQIWKRRFAEINNFEKYLVDNGILVLKCFLNLSKEEQRRRFLERIDTVEKSWKFSADDARERQFWPDYISAYEDCLSATSTKSAPWYVIPADFKPFSRLVVGHIIHAKLKSLKLAYPTIEKKQRQELLEARKVLNSERV